MSAEESVLSRAQVSVWRHWANLPAEERARAGYPQLPTLADVPAPDREWARDKGGFHIFFAGECGNWALELRPRAEGQDTTSFRPGCVAIRADGEPGAWLAVGGSYMAGADSWEKIA